MSSGKVAFRAQVELGDTIIPLVSEVVSEQSEASGGAKNGFIFALDLTPGQPPPVIHLGKIIDFVEQKLGAGPLAQNSGQAAIQQVFPGMTSFNSGNDTEIVIRSFLINSRTDQSLFSISVDIQQSEPKEFLPGELVDWLAIEKLAISFSATKKK